MASKSEMHRRLCVQNLQKFCYICGCYTFDGEGRKIDSFVKKLYFAYFKLKVSDMDKSFAPHSSCNSCVEGLRYLYAEKRKAMTFVIPMIWREHRNHYGDCYFSSAKLLGTRRKIRYQLSIQIFNQL